MKILAPTALIAALALAPAATRAQPAPDSPAAASPDSAFLTEAIEGDNNEVTIGQMAQTNGVSDKVRTYGHMLVMDHGDHRQKLIKMGVPATDALTDDGQKAADRLKALHGAAFDAAFRAHMIEDHQQDIAKYSHEVRVAKSAEVRAMATETLPTLRKHLAGARAL